MKMHLDIDGADSTFTQALSDAAGPLLSVLADDDRVSPSVMVSIFAILCLEHVVVVAKGAGYDRETFLSGLLDLGAFVFDGEHRAPPASVQ